MEKIRYLLYFWKTYMNERIYELATRAGAYCETYLHGGDPKPPVLDGMDLEKFAELIVRECLTAIDKTDTTHIYTTFDQGMVLGTIDKSKKAVQEHFGVW